MKECRPPQEKNDIKECQPPRETKNDTTEDQSCYLPATTTSCLDDASVDNEFLAFVMKLHESNVDNNKKQVQKYLDMTLGTCLSIPKAVWSRLGIQPDDTIKMGGWFNEELDSVCF